MTTMRKTDPTTNPSALLSDVAHIVQRVVPRDDWERHVLERFIAAVASTASQYPTSR